MHELKRYNILINTIDFSLNDSIKAIKGESLMTTEYELLCTQLSNN